MSASKKLSVGADMPRLETPMERDLLIALNAAEQLPRDTALRLAISPARWALCGKANRSSLGEKLGIDRRSLRAARDLLPRAAGIATEETRRAIALGGKLVTRLDPGYPSSLADLELPPPVLYCRGKLPSRPAVSIVGSRDADTYGLEVADRFARVLASRGLVVVSGFARGVDAAAHRGALTGGGKTVAVLGCGVDVDYPRGQRRLAGRIAESGAVISEFRMGTLPEAWRFPVRNRIIAALAVGTLVVRATQRSGSLITARQSLELGRDVYAVPGNILDRRSVGPNTLIRDGALAAQDPRDILEALPLHLQDRLKSAEVESAHEDMPDPEGESERQVLHALPPGKLMTQDEIVSLIELPIEQVVGHLLTLELGGWVRRYPGPSYGRRS
jgi:DNA processing protein